MNNIINKYFSFPAQGGLIYLIYQNTLFQPILLNLFFSVWRSLQAKPVWPVIQRITLFLGSYPTRMYGQNGKPTNMEYSFNGHRIKISTGDTAGDAFAFRLGKAKSSSIGILATKTLKIMLQNNPTLSNLYY